MECGQRAKIRTINDDFDLPPTFLDPTLFGVEQRAMVEYLGMIYKEHPQLRNEILKGIIYGIVDELMRS